MDTTKPSPSVHALILAAGYATRLYPLTLNKPKPLLKIDDRAIIDFAVQALNKIESVSDIVVVTNAKFYRHFCAWKKRARSTKRITIINDGTHNEEERLGAVGDIYLAVKKGHIMHDLLVIGGDNIFDMGLKEFVSFAQEKSPDVSIGIFDIKRKALATRFGVVKINKRNCQIAEFEEKPAHPKSTFVATCVYFFPKKTLSLLTQYVKNKLNADKSGYYIQWLLKKGKVFGFSFANRWIDIGQMDTYKEARRYFSRKKK